MFLNSMMSYNKVNDFEVYFWEEKRRAKLQDDGAEKMTRLELE
jgi:hypothetical protein